SGAGVPETLGYLLGVGLGHEQLFQAVQHPERGGVPELVDSRAALLEQAGNVPAGVAHRVVEGSSNRSVGRLEICAAVDERRGHVDVVAAGGPVKWRL